MALRLDALQAMHLDINRAELDARGYGSSHPRLVALDASRRALSGSSMGSRSVPCPRQVAQGAALPRRPEGGGEVNAFSSRGDGRAERAREVADEIALLSMQLVQSPLQHAAVGSCVQRETKPGAY
ncbi:MAG: hypothetical protein R3B07_09525 [Polyangiaceae bacterium]